MKDMKPRVLFILDKWCEGKISLGTSEWETNFWKSLKSTGLAEVITFHFDEYANRNENGNSDLLKLCEIKRPDLIFMVIYKNPDTDKTVPTYDTLYVLANEMKIPIVGMWGDLQIKSIVNNIIPYTTFNVYTALRSGADQVSKPDIFYYSWVPKDQSVFYDHGIERAIPLLYLGSPKFNRLEVIECIKSNGIFIEVTGGERKAHISTEGYALLLNQTKINLSFSRAGNPEKHVVNARVFETMLCGAMLLEQESEEIKHFYEPFVDYVPYISTNDMIEKIRYYLAHDDERIKIAEAGRDKTMKLYSAEKFWKKVFEVLKEVRG